MDKKIESLTEKDFVDDVTTDRIIKNLQKQIDKLKRTAKLHKMEKEMKVLKHIRVLKNDIFSKDNLVTLSNGKKFTKITEEEYDDFCAYRFALKTELTERYNKKYN